MTKQQPPSTLEAAQNYRGHPDAFVEAGEVADMRFPKGSHMTLRGAKLLHLLVQSAGVAVADDVTHRITLASLNDGFHVSVGELVELIHELQTTTLGLKLTDSRGRRYTKTGPILADVEREDETTAQAEVRYRFSPTMRKAIANSNHWAVISKRAVLAFESRYALRLYTVLSLRIGLRKATEDFTLDDLRAVLGVPPGKLEPWKSLRRRALEPALAEVNQLAGFHAGFVPITHGRKIVGVTLSWSVKNREARGKALEELNRPKVGRKARRYDQTEEVHAREELALSLNEAGPDDHPTGHGRGHGERDGAGQA